MNRTRANTLIVLCALLLVSACQRTQETESVTPTGSAPAAEAPRGIFADANIDDKVAGKWARSCALCHAAGVGGAPRVGLQSEWEARVKQGEETLLTHTIEGFNDMPPLGYCMSCEREDLRALIKMMAGGGS